MVYDPDNREASLVWRDGVVMDLEQQQEEDNNDAGIELKENE